MNNLTFHRLSRTPYSEQYQMFDGQDRVGYVDLHYAQTDVFGTLVLERELSDDDTADVIQQIDDALVESAETLREDFFVRVFVGRQLDEYSDVLRTEEEIEIDGQSPFELG
jgi:hypothetical protein